MIDEKNWHGVTKHLIGEFWVILLTMEPPFQTETLVQIESKSADKASGAMESKGGVDPPGLCEPEVVPSITGCKETSRWPGAIGMLIFMPVISMLTPQGPG